MRDLSITFVPHVEDGVAVGFFSLTLDVTEVKTLERKLAHLAGHDVLTGLPIGVALTDDPCTPAEELEARADAALHRAKAQ